MAGRWGLHACRGCVGTFLSAGLGCFNLPWNCRLAERPGDRDRGRRRLKSEQEPHHQPRAFFQVSHVLSSGGRSSTSDFCLLSAFTSLSSKSLNRAYRAPCLDHVGWGTGTADGMPREEAGMKDHLQRCLKPGRRSRLLGKVPVAAWWCALSFLLLESFSAVSPESIGEPLPGRSCQAHISSDVLESPLIVKQILLGG